MQTLHSEDQVIEAFRRRRDFVRYVKDGLPPAVSVRQGRKIDGDPRVTVIIPTTGRGRQRNLEHLLDQLSRQTYQQFEVIVVQGDRRQGRAINIGAAMARGELLMTMDDDTQLGCADLIEKLVSAFADPNIGIAGVANLIPPHAPWVARRAMYELPRRSSSLVERVSDSDMAEHPCLAIRKKLFYEAGGEHEWIPRGLDPYLRREIRRLGYRVVVVPGAWIHHLLPETLQGILRQYFRNGAGAAYVRKFYPEFIVDQALEHGIEPPTEKTLRHRALRYLLRTTEALARGKFIYVACQASYALGYVWGLISLGPDSL